MSAYETSTTVSGQGEIHLSALPFQPGTEVEVIVSPKKPEIPLIADNGRRTTALLSALDHAHNVESIGSLRRDQLYDRSLLR